MPKIPELLKFTDSSLKWFCSNAIRALSCHYNVLWNV